jgi:inner membrane protein
MADPQTGMAMDYWTFGLLSAGGTLMLAELVVPGGVLGWLGLSAFVIAGLHHVHIIEHGPAILAGWGCLSVVLTFVGAAFVQRFVGGEVEKKVFDEDDEAVGAVVLVEKLVRPHSDEGRILYHGTSWKARSINVEIAAGQEAVITSRDNITWLVTTPAHLKEG